MGLIARTVRPGWWTLVWFICWGYLVLLLAVR